MVVSVGCTPSAPDQPLELIDVELARFHPEHVAASLAEQPAVTKQLPQPVNVGIERLSGTAGRALAPKRLEQLVSGDDVVCVQQQHRQQDPLLAPSK